MSLHVRRGDYLQAKHWNAVGYVCQRAYYLNALTELGRRVRNPRYYVFSEDMDWVRENLPLGKDTVWVDWNQGEDSWQDMMLMSRCRHHIICNSTFSWWAAWLDPRPDKLVLAPERWARSVEGREIEPDSWIKVPIE